MSYRSSRSPRNSCLPDSPNSKQVQLNISAQYKQISSQRLCSNHAIKRIAMLPRQSPCSQCAARVNSQHRVTSIFHYIQKLSLQRLRSGKFAKPYLGCNLPCRGGRDKNHITLICNDRRCLLTEGRGREHSPKQCVRVEQDLHSPSPFHSRSSSSGNGSKNASVNSNPGVSNAPSRLFPTG